VTTTPAAKPDLKAVPAAKPTPKGRKPAAPKPPAEPKIDLGARQVTTWVPIVTMPGGKKITCPHSRYGHESEKAAKACSRSLIAQAAKG
jgi:hypothetical protein